MADEIDPVEMKRRERAITRWLAPRLAELEKQIADINTPPDKRRELRQTRRRLLAKMRTWRRRGPPEKKTRNPKPDLSPNSATDILAEMTEDVPVAVERTLADLWRHRKDGRPLADEQLANLDREWLALKRKLAFNRKLWRARRQCLRKQVRAKRDRNSSANDFGMYPLPGDRIRHRRKARAEKPFSMDVESLPGDRYRGLPNRNDPGGKWY